MNPILDSKFDPTTLGLSARQEVKSRERCHDAEGYWRRAGFAGVHGIMAIQEAVHDSASGGVPGDFRARGMAPAAPAGNTPQDNSFCRYSDGASQMALDYFAHLASSGAA